MLYLNGSNGIYYATSSDSGTTWSSFTLITGTTGYTLFTLNMSSDGTRGVCIDEYGAGMYSIYWTGATPVATWVGSGSGAYVIGASMTLDGNYLMWLTRNGSFWYTTWNSTSNAFNAPTNSSYSPGGKTANIVYVSGLITLTPKADAVYFQAYDGTNIFIYYLSVSWAGATATLSNLTLVVSLGTTNRSPAAVVGGATSSNPTNIIFTDGYSARFLTPTTIGTMTNTGIGIQVSNSIIGSRYNSWYTASGSGTSASIFLHTLNVS